MKSLETRLQEVERDHPELSLYEACRKVAYEYWEELHGSQPESKPQTNPPNGGVMCISRRELSEKLLCHQRTLNRRRETKELLPIMDNPVTYAIKDVVYFLNKHRLGLAAVLYAIPDDFIKTADTACMLGITPQIMRSWMRNSVMNGIPHFRPSSNWVLYRESEVKAWVESKRQK